MPPPTMLRVRLRKPFTHDAYQVQEETVVVSRDGQRYIAEPGYWVIGSELDGWTTVPPSYFENVFEIVEGG